MRFEKRKSGGGRGRGRGRGRGVNLANLQYLCLLVKQPSARLYLCRQLASDQARRLRRRLLRTLRGKAVQERW